MHFYKTDIFEYKKISYTYQGKLIKPFVDYKFCKENITFVLFVYPPWHIEPWFRYIFMALVKRNVNISVGLLEKHCNVLCNQIVYHNKIKAFKFVQCISFLTCLFWIFCVFLNLPKKLLQIHISFPRANLAKRRDCIYIYFFADITFPGKQYPHRFGLSHSVIHQHCPLYLNFCQF